MYVHTAATGIVLVSTVTTAEEVHSLIIIVKHTSPMTFPLQRGALWAQGLWAVVSAGLVLLIAFPALLRAKGGAPVRARDPIRVRFHARPSALECSEELGRLKSKLREALEGVGTNATRSKADACRHEQSVTADHISGGLSDPAFFNYTSCEPVAATPARGGARDGPLQLRWMSPTEARGVLAKFPRVLFLGDSVERRLADVLHHYGQANTTTLKDLDAVGKAWRDPLGHNTHNYTLPGGVTLRREWQPLASDVIRRLRQHSEQWDAIIIGSPDHDMAQHHAGLYLTELQDLCETAAQRQAAGPVVLLSGVFLTGESTPYRDAYHTDIDPAVKLAKYRAVLMTKLMANHFGLWYMDHWDWVDRNPSSCLDDREKVGKRHKAEHIHFVHFNAKMVQLQLLLNTLEAASNAARCEPIGQRTKTAT